MTEHRDPTRWARVLEASQAGAGRIWRPMIRVPRRYPLVCIVVAFTLIVAAVVWRTQQISDRQAASSHQEVLHNRERIAQQKTAADAQHEHDQALIACLGNWGQQLVRVLNERGAQANPRLDKLFDAINVAVKHPSQQARTRQLITQAIRLHKQYKRFSRKHPLPVPELHCDLSPVAIKASPGAPRPTRTVFVTRTPAPHVRTVHVAGPVVHRTVVRTVTVVPGKARGRHRGR